MAGPFERLWGLWRADAAPPPSTALALPGPVAPFSAYRDDGGVYNPFTGLGGPSDKGAAALPNPYALRLSDDQLRAAYTDNGVVRRIVDVLPNGATRRGWSCPDVPASEDTRLRTWERVGEAMSLAGAYGGAVGLMATEDMVPRSARGRPQDWLMQPLDLARIGSLHALHVFDAFEAAIAAWNEDPLDPGFGEPLVWDLWRGNFHVRVHASRVLWFRGRKRSPSQLQGGWGRSNRMPDDSLVQAIWDDIGRYCATMQGGAVLAQELRESVIKVSGYSMKSTGDDATAFKRMLSLISRTKSLLGLVVLGEKDEYENRSNPPTGFKELSEGQLTALRFVLGWPSVMLTGEAPGGLSTDDKAGRERERQLTSDYQERHRHLLERFYTVVCAAHDGPTGGRVPEELGLTFARLDEPTEAETAELRLKVAQTDAIYVQMGAVAAEDITHARFGEEGYSMELGPIEPPDLDDEAAIERARQLLEAGGDPGGGGGDPDEPGGDPRADAAGPRSCVIWVPAVDPGLASAVQAAIGQPLTAEREPHITLLYMGELAEGAEPDVVGAVAAVAADWRPETIERGSVRAFPFGEGGVPIVIEFGSWSLSELNTALLRRLAHLVTAQQHESFRAHITIGYAPQPLSADALARLSQIDASGVRVSVAALVVSVGGTNLATIPFGA